jgi:ribosome-associated translation inhibitor RaiA
MQNQLQITLQDVSPSAALDKRIRDKASKLEKIFPRLTACRVVISAPHHHQVRRRLYTVRLNIIIPGGEIVVTRNNHEDVYVVLRDAFVAARRELETHLQRHDRNAKRGSMSAAEPSLVTSGEIA